MSIGLKINKSSTKVEVSYEYIGSSKKGNKFIKEFTPSDYKAFIGEWNNLLENYFESNQYIQQAGN